MARPPVRPKLGQSGAVATGVRSFGQQAADAGDQKNPTLTPSQIGRAAVRGAKAGVKVVEAVTNPVGTAAAHYPRSRSKDPGYANVDPGAEAAAKAATGRARSVAPSVSTPPKTPRPAVKHTPSQLPSTSGKTTVPSRSVQTPDTTPTPARPARVAKSTAARKTTPVAKTAAAVAVPAGPSLAQLAQQIVNQDLAGQYAQQSQDNTQNVKALQAFTAQLMQAVQPLAGQINSDYQNAVSQIGGLSSAAADSLRAANPNASEQQLLQAVGAPDSQQQQIAGQLNNAFNGAAAVSQYLNGVLPATALESNRLALGTVARSLPAVEALRGQQSLAAQQFNDAQARAKIAAQAPSLLNSALNQLTTAQAKQDQLALEQKALGLKVNNQNFAQQLAQAKLKLSAGNAAAKAGQIDSSVSKILGYAATADGTPVTQGGKIIPVNQTTGAQGKPKLPTASQLNQLVTTWHDGKVGSVTVPAVDQNGDPVFNPDGSQKYQSKSVQVGKLDFKQAYRRLRAMGLSDVKARQYLDTAYARGDSGRAWLTNEEQAALKKAGLTAKATVVSGKGVLNPKQTAALRKVGKLPPGQLTREGFYVIQTGF